MQISERHINGIKQLCVNYKVRTLSAFGSVVTDNLKDSSDIDFVVDFNESDPFNYTDLYFQLKDELELLLHRPIDLVEARGVKNLFFQKELDNTKVMIYG